METFHLVVLTIAIVMLVLVLTLIGLLLGKKDKNVAYPPSYDTCPDYWTVTQDGSNCIIPTIASSLNVGTLYNPSTGALNPAVSSTPGYSYDASNNQYLINFNASGWSGTCSMQTWANKNGVVWDGVSNYNLCNT